MFKLNHIKNDFYGGITTAVVALPLALAFGVTSGIGAIAGLWGAIILGFFAALFGGTKSQISGPTSPMTIVMSGIVLTYNSELDLIFTIVALTGLIQILFGNLWSYINPWYGPAKIIFKGKFLYKYPSKLSFLPPSLGFFSFALFMLVDIAPDDPDRLAIVVLLYWFLNFILIN